MRNEEKKSRYDMIKYNVILIKSHIAPDVPVGYQVWIEDDYTQEARICLSVDFFSWMTYDEKIKSFKEACENYAQ